jgi:hypothetical protein
MTRKYRRPSLPKIDVPKRRWHVSIRPEPRLDQGPQSRQHRCAAGAERDLESMIPRQRASDSFMDIIALGRVNE